MRKLYLLILISLPAGGAASRGPAVLTARIEQVDYVQSVAPQEPVEQCLVPLKASPTPIERCTSDVCRRVKQWVLDTVPPKKKGSR